MSARLLLIATLLTVVLPLLVCIGIFFVALPWWIDRRLRSDLAVQQRLRLAVSDGSLAWVIDPDPTTPTRLPYFLLMVAALAGLVIMSVETATFASRSGVPDLWYTAGVFASALVLVGPFAVAWICKGPLCRSVERALGRHANEKLSFAAPSLHEIGAVGRDIDEAYAAMGLRSRFDIVRLGREALLAHAWLGRDSALAESSGSGPGPIMICAISSISRICLRMPGSRSSGRARLSGSGRSAGCARSARRSHARPAARRCLGRGPLATGT